MVRLAGLAAFAPHAARSTSCPAALQPPIGAGAWSLRWRPSARPLRLSAQLGGRLPFINPPSTSSSSPLVQLLLSLQPHDHPFAQPSPGIIDATLAFYEEFPSVPEISRRAAAMADQSVFRITKVGRSCLVPPSMVAWRGCRAEADGNAIPHNRS